MKALIIVDVQNDFLPGGALPAPDGNRVIPVINQLMDQFKLVVASRDWHPADTVHFEKWPVHCVAESRGADFPENLNTAKINKLLFKGTNNNDDGYSAFEATNLNLYDFLKEQQVDEVYVTGLTTEYCVKNTVLDALRLGFKTFAFTDAVEGVKAQPGDEQLAWHEVKNAGAHLLTSTQFN